MDDWGNVAEITTAVATVCAVAVAISTIIAKRRDDRRADRLTRINRQLSEFYGKLSILYEAGMSDWLSFVSQHGNDSQHLGKHFRRFFPYEIKESEPITQFNPPPPTAEQLAAYRKWLRTLFMKTNERMLEVIYSNVDLVVGKTMPQVFVIFASHVASLRLLLLALEEEERIVATRGKSTILDDWQQYVKLMSEHPGGRLGFYLNAAFEVLKEEQERLLSTDDEPLTEIQIAENIRVAVNAEAQKWRDLEHEARAAAGQHYSKNLAPEIEKEV
jgi:hypothetical protein